MAVPRKKAEERKPSISKVTHGNLTWTDIVDPDPAARQYLEANFQFNPMDLDDYFSPRQLSKVDEYQSYLFIIFHLGNFDKATRVSTIYQWAAFVGDKYLVTLHPSFLRTLATLREECAAGEEVRQGVMGQGAGYLLYVILDRTVDSYFPVLDRIMSLVDQVEDRVFDEGVEAGREISILRRDIFTQRRVMFPLRALLREIEGKLKRFSKTDLAVYWGDLIDHMNKIADTLDAGKETIEIFKDADYTLSGYRANHVIRVIAMMLAVALPFLVIGMLWGVVLLGGFVEGNWLIHVLLFVLAAVLAAGGLYALRARRLI